MSLKKKVRDEKKDIACGQGFYIFLVKQRLVDNIKHGKYLDHDKKSMLRLKNVIHLFKQSSYINQYHE